MPDAALFEKTIAVRLESRIPIVVRDETGAIIGSAQLEGFMGVTLVVDKHHPFAFDLENDTGLARLKLSARVEDNVVDGAFTVGGGR
jgi:hypothetical protein